MLSLLPPKLPAIDQRDELPLARQQWNFMRNNPKVYYHNRWMVWYLFQSTVFYLSYTIKNISTSNGSFESKEKWWRICCRELCIQTTLVTIETLYEFTWIWHLKILIAVDSGGTCFAHWSILNISLSWATIHVPNELWTASFTFCNEIH